VGVKNILNTIKKGLKAKIYSLQKCQDFKSEASVVGKSKSTTLLTFHTKETSETTVFLNVIKNILGAFTATRQVQYKIPGLQNPRTGIVYAFPLKADTEKVAENLQRSQSICSWTLILTRNLFYSAVLDAEYLQYSRANTGVNTLFPCKQ